VSAAGSHNFASMLAGHAAARPDAVALAMAGDYHPEDGYRLYDTLSFKALHERSDALAWGLQERLGISRGERVSMLVTPGFEFFVVGMALYKLGAVPVLIDPGMGREGFLRCVAANQPSALIAIPAGQALSRVFSSSFGSVKRRLTVGGGAWLFGGLSYDACLMPERGPFPMAEVAPDSEASILFTSGSTGPAKGVVYTHGMFTTQAQLIGRMMGIRAGESDVPCFLPFAMFSVSLGMTVTLPEINFAKPATAKAKAVLAALHHAQADQLVGSPAVMARLIEHGEERGGLRLPQLKRVLTFGAPISPAIHEAFRRLVGENVEIFTPYGATEALPLSVIGSREILAGAGAKTAVGAGTCVGRPIDEVTVRVIPITDGPVSAVDPVPQGEIGEITVLGPMVSPEYKELPQENAVAKVDTAEGRWHRMGDVGYVDEFGRLWFCGRKSHRVPLKEGGVIFPDRLEGLFNAHLDVARTAVVGVAGEPVLIVEPKETTRLRRDELVRALLAMAQTNDEARRVRRVLFYDRFPVDRRHNAKIDRPALAAWAARAR
jgi:acyl-CoA synthetase (AMP-forming)/AMP-acid ligase II